MDALTGDFTEEFIITDFQTDLREDGSHRLIVKFRFQPVKPGKDWEERVNSFLEKLSAADRPVTSGREGTEMRLLGDLACRLGAIYGDQTLEYSRRSIAEGYFELVFSFRRIYTAFFSILLATYIIHQIYRAGEVDQRSRELLQMGRIYFRNPQTQTAALEEARRDVVATMTGRFSNDAINAFISLIYPNRRTIRNILKKILLVDDETRLGEIYNDILASRGFSVHTAPDGREALTLLRRNSYDLLVTDIEMPEMGGEELFRHVQINYPRLPVMFITGMRQQDDLEQLLRRGVVACLMKPFSLQKFVLEVEAAIYRQPVLRSK
jgi:CheY-like chemotaxis protein